MPITVVECGNNLGFKVQLGMVWLVAFGMTTADWSRPLRTEYHL